MSTVSKSFTATGVSTPEFVLRPGDTMNYAVSGTFSATVLLERSRSGLQSFEAVATATAAASGSITNESKSNEYYRFRCSVYASGTAVTSIADAAASSEKRMVPATGIAKVGGTAGWAVAPADNVSLVTCPASQTGSKLIVPICGLMVGERIAGFHLVGQIESAGGAVTVDADLRKHTSAAADVADASVGAITQLSVTADTIMSESNTRKGDLDETVGRNETFYVVVTATTAASTDIALQGIVVEVLPPL